MNKLDAITASKIIRKCLDEVLQEMKEHKNQLCLKWDDSPENMGEVLANHTLSIRAVEDAILRQGMVLKNIGATPNPYPESYNPDSPVVAPTADGLKM